MSIPKSKRAKPQRPRGNVYKPADLRGWANYWDCSPGEIRDAVRISGPMIVDIQDWLKLNVAR